MLILLRQGLPQADDQPRQRRRQRRRGQEAARRHDPHPPVPALLGQPGRVQHEPGGDRVGKIATAKKK